MGNKQARSTCQKGDTMYQITKSKVLAQNIFYFDVYAPRIASYCLPGQFVIVRSDEDAERIPLTICDYNRDKGTVTLVFQIVGAGSLKLSKLSAGDSLCDIVGPLGCASELCDKDIDTLKSMSILFVAGGVGTAPVYPQAKWLNDHGVDCDVIIGAKTKDMLILTDEMKQVATNLYITTDDGSYGSKGLVTNVIDNLISQGKHYDLCVAIGPMIMMKFCALTTKKYSIPTVVSLNPIMVDGTGMCGACRVTVGDEIKFACVDGPEFDGHKVDFDEAMKRQQIYKSEEGRAYLKELEGDTHHGGCSHCGGDH